MSALEKTLVVIQEQLIRYAYSAYLIFGVTGCGLNIVLFSQRQFRTVSCCLYFIMSSAAMLIAVPLGVAPFIHSLHYPNPYTTILAFCKFRTYMLQSTTMMYRWSLTVACVDRCLLTSTNVRWRSFASVPIAYRVIALLVLVWLAVPLQALVLFSVWVGRCGVLHDVAASLYFSSYTITTGSILPVSIMIICAVLIRRNLVLKRERRQQLTSHAQNGDQRVFAMLLLQAIAFLITQTPWMLLFFYTALMIYVTNKSADRVAIERFVTFKMDMIVFLFPTASFYFYTLVSRQFRQELKKLFCRFLRRRMLHPFYHWLRLSCHHRTSLPFIQ